MKNSRIKGFEFVLCMALLFGTALNGRNHLSVFAADEGVEISDLGVERMTQDIFGDYKIKSAEYLYSLNDSPDFVYVNFENYGYAIFMKDTAELLEYSPSGNLSFPNTFGKKYYGGPTNYFSKNNEYFVDIDTNESFAVSKVNREFYSKNLLNVFSRSGVDHKNKLEIINTKVGEMPPELEQSGSLISGSDDKPSLDDEGIIIADLPGTAGTTYIPNADYFLHNPRHGSNSTGTCGAVAAQLMLSYHNYFSDRRIISDQHLNGWDQITNTVAIPNDNPNHSEDPNSMTRETLGSNGINETDDNTYFNLVVNAIPANATTKKVRNGLRNILNARNSQISSNINYSVDSHVPTFFIGPIGESGIKNEIDAGRPALLLMQESLGGWDHFVVAYGYQNMISPTNGSTYSGYITHFGHSGETPNRLNVWVNSAWTYSYVTMNVTHTHSYTTTGMVFNGSEMIHQCSCGHRVTDSIFNVSGNTITGLKYSLANSTGINIPSTIDGLDITAIGASAFANQTLLSQITVTNSVVTIGSNAFLNTNSAPIYLLGQSSLPTTFHYNWNSSGNPVYLNGVICNHSLKTLTNISSTQHGQVCDACRTTSNITSHTYTHNYSWYSYQQHRAMCECGAFKTMGHVVASNDPGVPYKTCLHCGGPADTGFVQARMISFLEDTLVMISIEEYFGNGSYILSNGVIVISQDDLDSYLSGELLLPNCEDCSNHYNGHSLTE